MKVDNTYPERGPETYWDQLGQPTEARKTSHRIAVEFGENEEGKCPTGKGGQIQVEMSTERQDSDLSVWPFNVCEEQRRKQNFADEDGKILYPATFACAMASWGPKPKNMSVSVSFNNVSFFCESKIEFFLHAHLA
jgi:hypothetical protein